jgi:hydrogenase maturation protein HypF
MGDLEGVRIHITGVVQGVGFRPFVFGLATRLGLLGWVRNTSAGVDIQLDGTKEAIRTFTRALREQAPPLARIDDILVDRADPNGFTEFQIIHSQPLDGAFQPISPDVSLCLDCERELFDPQDRRYRYPFINCTNCGPRFTIIKDIPYDRPNTTMEPFQMCPDCSKEYHNPLDRRFHAQPVACPNCGPRIWLETDRKKVAEDEDALQLARKYLRDGKIVAIKGLGGFHLACDAIHAESVIELRRRKLRVDKAFAIMMPDFAVVNEHCIVGDAERELLLSHERPIVILQRREGSTIAGEVAPGQVTLGVMLPYTPLHSLLLEKQMDFPEALVMTSGNLSEEPIATENQEARDRLENLADAFLMHDRGIQTRCDDSVVRVFEKEIYPLRRSRGYAPYPVRLKQEGIPLLAVGAELKNTFCITRGSYAFLSQHIGDMENYDTLRSFEEGIEHFERLFRVKPQAIGYDLHPNYMATRYALERSERDNLPAVGVQHHHAHIAACMAENGLEGVRPVIGVSFDGTGYGDDGAVWGGEFLICTYSGYQRSFHLSYIPLPGGDMAIHQPWRLAWAWLDRLGIEPDSLPSLDEAVSPEEGRIVMQQIEKGINTPPTSSMGRLFDAVAALCGIRYEVNYEAQAAIEFEAIVDPEEEGHYNFTFGEKEIDPAPLLRSLIRDRMEGVATGKIAARFHNTVARMVLEVCDEIRTRASLSEVALSGGVWQNMVLLSKTVATLRASGFSVYIHRKVPANDGGIALGQAVVTLHSLDPTFEG